MATQNRQDLTDSLPLVQGAMFGAASFLAGYIVTLVIVAATEAEDLTEDLVEAAGFIYYNAQLADIEVAITGDAGFGALLDGTTFNYVTDDQVLGEVFGLETPSIVYHAVPVLILVVFGFLLARRVNARTVQEGALAGGSLVLGVVPLTLVGTFLFSLEDGGVELAPILTDSLLFVGLLFPLVFGVLGGVLSTQLDSTADGDGYR